MGVGGRRRLTLLVTGGGLNQVAEAGEGWAWGYFRIVLPGVS